MDVLDRSYAKKLFNGLSSGYVSNTVTDNADGSKTLTINFVNGDKANITFTSVNGKGIKSITAEYYMSTSKTSQTGGSWVTTCPQWQANNYLWTRSKITYTDDTTSYTNASVDSSWEAVNNIQSSARNLVKNSCFKDNFNNWNLREWSSYFTIDNNNTLNGHKSLKISATGLTENKWIGVKQNLTTLPLRSGETYYISCWYYCEDKSTFDNGFALELKGRKEGATSDETIYNEIIASDKLIENKWTRISGKIALKDDWENAYIYTWVEKNGVINVTDIMVSKSDILTDWMPAPEDTQSQIDDVVQRVSTLQKQYDDTAIKNNISALQTGKVDKVSGKSLVDDTEIARLAKVDNYDDTALKKTIQTVANGLMASAGYSADYKTVEIVTVGGTKKNIPIAPIINNASITELKDVDKTDQGDGKVLVFNSATGKHEYKEVSGTDEKVKMNSTSDAKYLSDLIDKKTIEADTTGQLVAKTLDGLEASVTELNFIKGLQMPVQDLVNAFANGGLKTIDTPFSTYADLQSYDVSTLLDDIRYLVRVLADETHDNKITAYLIKKGQKSPTFYGFLSDSRDFTTNPISLINEVTGKLKSANIDTDDLFALLTLSDVYKTATTKDEFFGTNGAKAMYDELNTAIGKKANTTDLTTHTGDTDIHVTSAEKDEIKKIKDKADATALDDKEDIANKVTTLSNASTDKQYPSAKTVWEFFGIKTVETGSIKEWALDDTNCPRGRRTYVYCQDVVTDLPTTGEWWYVMVDKPDILTTNLVAKPIKSNKEYYCYYRNDSSTWSDWNSNIISSDITTTIDKNSTNSQIPSAKAVYDNSLMYEIHPVNSNYNIDTIKNYTMTHVNVNSGCMGTYPAEFVWGTFLQLPANDYRTQILISTQGMYYRIMNGGKWQPWYKVNATKVTDTTTYPKETP